MKGEGWGGEGRGGEGRRGQERRGEERGRDRWDEREGREGAERDSKPCTL